MNDSTYDRNTGTTGRSAAASVPCGTFSSSTMIVIRIAITPSLNASMRVLLMARTIGEGGWRSRSSLEPGRQRDAHAAGRARRDVVVAVGRAVVARPECVLQVHLHPEV